MEQAAAQWRYDELHKDAPFHDGTFPEDPSAWSAVRSLDTPYRYDDGTNVWVSEHDLTPADHFLGRRRADDDEEDLDDDPTARAG